MKYSVSRFSSSSFSDITKVFTILRDSTQSRTALSQCFALMNPNRNVFFLEIIKDLKKLKTKNIVTQRCPGKGKGPLDQETVNQKFSNQSFKFKILT